MNRYSFSMAKKMNCCSVSQLFFVLFPSERFDHEKKIDIIQFEIQLCTQEITEIGKQHLIVFYRESILQSLNGLTR